MSATSNLPNLAMPLVDAGGRMAPAWAQFFMAMLTRTGGSTGVLADELLSQIASSRSPVDLSPMYALINALEASSSALTGSSAPPYDGLADGSTGPVTSDLRRRIEELEMQLATLAPAPVVPAALPLSVTTCFAAYQSAAQNYPATTFSQVQFQTKQFDDLSEFNAATSLFTAQVAGTYVFTAGVTGSQSTSNNRAIALYVNGSEHIRLQQNTAMQGNVVMSGASVPLRLAAGDTVAVYYFTALADTGSTGATYTYFGGERIK